MPYIVNPVVVASERYKQISLVRCQVYQYFRGFAINLMRCRDHELHRDNNSYLIKEISIGLLCSTRIWMLNGEEGQRVIVNIRA